MRPDTSEVRYWTVIGWQLIMPASDWLEQTCAIRGEWNKHDLLDVRELAAVTLGGPGTGDRICNVAN